MLASSRAPRFLLLLFSFLSVLLASARKFPELNTPAEVLPHLNVTITDHLNPSSDIFAEKNQSVMVTVKNGGTHSIKMCLHIVPRQADSRGYVKLTATGGGVFTVMQVYDTVLAGETRTYIFVAETEGWYRCEIEEGESMTVLIVQYHKHEHLISVLEEAALPPGNELVTADTEALEMNDLYYYITYTNNISNAIIDTSDEDFSSPTVIPKSNACEHPTTLINCHAINWSEKEHRRACLARIVNTVYCGHNNVSALNISLVNTGFILHEEPLKDGSDMYAAIYKYVGKAQQYAPDIIVAFRGTEMCFNLKTVKDNMLNCVIGVNAVEHSQRFKLAYKKINELTRGKHRVWLTGHSQGASLALQVGRTAMLEKEIDLPTYAFNPPLSIVCWFPHSAKKVIGIMMQIRREEYVQLSKWTPVLYVHTKDFVFCRSMIPCLENPTPLDKCVTKLPSAMLCQHSGEVEGGMVQRFLGPHSLEQWFKPISPPNLRCKAINSTDCGGNLNCPTAMSNTQDSEKDIEAQQNQNPEAPSPILTGRNIIYAGSACFLLIVGGIVGRQQQIHASPLMNRLRTHIRRPAGWFARLAGRQREKLM